MPKVSYPTPSSEEWKVARTLCFGAVAFPFMLVVWLIAAKLFGIQAVMTFLPISIGSGLVLGIVLTLTGMNMVRRHK
jgi:hypothetical protein